MPIDNEPIRLTDSPPTDETIKIMQPEGQQIAPDVADVRAKKYDFGISDPSLPFDSLKFSIQQGTESVSREQAAHIERMREAAKRNEATKTFLQATPPGEVTQDHMRRIYQLNDPKAIHDSVDPQNVFEKAYAKKTIDTGLGLRPTDVTQEADTKVATEQGVKVVSRKEQAQHLVEGLEQERKDSSWGSYLGDLGENFIPGFSWYNLTNVIPNTSNRTFWLGDNLRDQAYAYYSEPDDAKAKEMLDSAIKRLKEVNLGDAIQFARFIANATASDVLLANLITAGDASLILPKVGFGGLAIVGGKMAFNKITGKTVSQAGADAVRDIVKATSGRRTTPETIAEAAGDTATSGDTLAVKKLTEQADTLNRPSQMGDLKGEMTSITNPDDIMTGAGNAVSAERQVRMKDFLKNSASKLIDGIFNRPMSIQRIATDSDTMREAKALALDQWKNQHDGFSDAILNVRPAYKTTDDILRDNLEPLYGKMMQQIHREGKLDNYNKYLIATDEYAKARALLDQVALQSSEIPLSIPQVINRTGKGTKSKGGKYWREILENIIDLPVSDEATAAAKLKLAKAIEDVASIPAKDRDTFMNVRNSEQALGTLTKRGTPAIPDVSLVKDLGNVDYLAVKLGQRAQWNKELFEKLSPEAKITVGKNQEATLFDSAENAHLYAQDIYKLSNFKVKQQGTGWFIETYKPIDETASSVRTALMDETRAQTPGMVTAALGVIRSPEYFLPEGISSARHITAYGTSALTETLKDALKPVSALQFDKQAKRDFLRFLQLQHDTKGADGVPGKFSENQGQLYREWHQHFNRLPSEKEEMAYWSYVQVSNAELGVTNLRVYTAKAREGLEQFSFGKIGGFTPDAPFIEGKFMDAVPDLPMDFGVLVKHADGSFEYMRKFGGATHRAEPEALKRRPLASKEGEFYKKKVPTDVPDITPTEKVNRALFDDLTQSGYKTVQIGEYGEKAMREAASKAGVELPDGAINFVMSKDVRSAPLDYVQIPNKPGGHTHYVSEFYLRQPKLAFSPRDTRYFGDHNIFGFQTRKEADQFQKSFETARNMYQQLIRGNIDDAAFDAFTRAATPYSGKVMRELFEKGHFDPNIPFYTTGANETVDKAHNLSQVYRPNITDKPFVRVSDTDLGLYKSLDLKNLMEKGDTLQSIAQSGTKENPVFKLSVAKTMDPLPTLERHASEVFKGRYIEDLKFKQAEEFAARFGDLLAIDGAELRSNPLRWLYEAPFKQTASSQGRLNAAVAFRRSALEFLGQKSVYDKDMNYMKQLGMDYLFGKKIGGAEANEVLEPWMQHATTSWTQKVKNAAFHAKMSFMNPAQFFIQSQGIVHVIALEGPARASKVFPAMTLSRFASAFDETPEGLAKLGQAVSKVSTWKPDHFVEAYQSMKESGFSSVGRERADMDNFMTGGVLQTKVGRAIDWTSGLVKSGERWTRHAAYLAAYDRWRTANPLAKLTNDAKAEILDRANLLNVDMSSASNATYQKGVTGLMSQFWSYNIRLFEQMTGNRLTAEEKARVLITNSIMYGVPTGAGVMAFGLPTAEMNREDSLKKGYEPENILTRIANFGALNEPLRLIMGENTNIGERYGPGNMAVFRDFFKDKSGAEMLFGIGGTFFRDAVYAVAPIGMFMLDGVMQSEHVYKPTTEDFRRALSNISGYNNAEKTLIALTTGQYFSRQGAYVDKVTPTEALIKGVFGIDTMRISDLPKIKDINRDLAALQAKEEPLIRQSFVAALQAFDDGNTADGYKHHTNMMARIIWAGYREDQRAQLFSRLVRGMESQVDSVSRKFAMQSPEKLEAFKKRINARSPQ